MPLLLASSALRRLMSAERYTLVMGCPIAARHGEGEEERWRYEAQAKKKQVPFGFLRQLAPRGGASAPSHGRRRRACTSPTAARSAGRHALAGA